jgi:guanine deaminase
VQPFRIHAPLLTPISPVEMRWHPDGVVAVDSDGCILFSGDARDIPERLLSLELLETEDVLLPGFVDLHVHLPQYDCRGKFGASLMEWLDRFIFPAEARFADPEIARDTAQRFFAGLRDAGTTTAMVYSSVHARATDIAFEEAGRSGLRIVMGKVQMDRDVPEDLLESVEQSTREVIELIERWHRSSDKLWYAVTPRFAPTCTMEMLKACAGLAVRYGTYIQTHINESTGEIASVREFFPGHASYMDVYRDAGLLTDCTVLGHNIHPGDDELRMCEERGCAVAHCPDSNLFLGSGRFPLERYSSTSIRVGLGSDVGAGTTLCMFPVMRSMSYVQGRSLHPFVPLYHATLGGARALSLEGEIGSLDEGKLADMIAVRVDRHFCGGKPLEQLKPLEIASALVYRSQPSDVTAVWVGGERVLP